jgi:hypothetical protein
MRAMAIRLQPQVRTSSKTLLKMIDEYNYAKFTKHWI